MNDPVNKPPAKMSSRERDELLKKGISVAPPQSAPVQPQTQEQAQENQQVIQEIEEKSEHQEIHPSVQQQPETSPHLPSTDAPSSPQPDNDKSNDNDNEQESTPRGFVCEKCKWCDGFEPLEGNIQVCRVCKCDLIFHIDMMEEDEEDADEFSSGEEDIWEDRKTMQAESSSDQD